MYPVLEYIEKFAVQAQETWEDEAFQQRLKNLREHLVHMVRKNPAGSVAIAMLAGFLIGKITKRGK